ncbi:MAG: hypothetical protein A2511_17880 [Deltaproteobacteria bacterium RIFOXYD12_FULL_50_9]|nr:MAG: hypothetical protein A2511_17880 [Deltaproteobacteria bacterium RIFOXYD12_FULL_50_9]
MAETKTVFYWDTSALLSRFFTDIHSGMAQKWSEIEAVHLLSSLAHAEASAVIARMTREKVLEPALSETICKAMGNGPWRVLNGLPDRSVVADLSQKWPLRGADLWHLALAVSLKKDLPEIRLLTFDDRLLEAAAGEELIEKDDLVS